MKKILYFTLLGTLAACGLAACGEEEGPLGASGTVNLNINANFDAEPLVMDQSYLLGNSKEIKFGQFNFFISNIILMEAETSDETDLLDIALADFSDNTSPSTVEPESFSFKVVPAVKYKGIKFGIGVQSSLNKSSASSYGAGHPLKKAFDTHFWKDGGSFFFAKMAGSYDPNGENSAFELFPAKNGNYITVQLDKAFSLENGKTVDLDVTLDVLKLLQTTAAQPIDFSDTTNLSTYDPENDGLSSLLMGNFETAMEIE